MYAGDSQLVIFEAAFTSKSAVHAYLASALDFPGYYGANLDALVDCLTDVAHPTRISLIRMRDEGPLAQWFDKLALALMVSARENPALDIEIFFG